MSSAHFGQYSYREYSGATGLKKILQTKPQNALIFVCNIDITDDIKMLAYHNDLIYLDITHPFESNPSTDILFS